MWRPCPGRLSLLVLLFVECARFSSSSRVGTGARVGVDPRGRVVFQGGWQPRASGNSGPGDTFGEGSSHHRELYRTKVGFNLNEMNTSQGVQVVFDKEHQAMRLDLTTGASEGIQIAWGFFSDQIDSTGWSELQIDTTDYVQVSNDVRMYAAGFVEGILTARRFAKYMKNMRALLQHYSIRHPSLPNVRGLFNQELTYWREKTNLVGHAMVEEPRETYWRHARYLLLQLWGICDGFNEAAYKLGEPVIDIEDLMLINAAGELPQLMQAFSPEAARSRVAPCASAAQPLGSAPGPAPGPLDSPAPGVPLSPAEAPAPPPAPLPMQPAAPSVAPAPNQPPAPATGAGAPGPSMGPGLSFLQRLRSRAAGSAAGTAWVAERAATTSDEKRSNASSVDPLDDAHWERRVIEGGRCSAFLRLTDDNGDIFMGHTTWDDYSKMTRIFKYYRFDLQGCDTVAKVVGFSSYPGALTSTDDFYVMDTRLAVMETSLEILDLSAWSRVWDFPDHPHIPNFVHIMITNRLARSAPDWSWHFSRMNTGTYTSQWMVVDYKLLEDRPPLSVEPLKEHTFWLVEEVPGVTESKDMTSFLMQYRYFPSFNRPFFPKTRAASGHAAAEESHGALYSWANNPRAVLFRSAATDVESLYDMRLLMQRNRFPNTGVSPSSPGHEISARFDLVSASAVPNGGIDSKIINRCLLERLEVQAISGPSHESLPAFRWRSESGAELWPGWPHVGLPDVWNFGFVQITRSAITPIQANVTDISICGV